MSTRRLPLPVALLLALVVAAPAVADFVTFESGQVRPLALSPDGTQALRGNTPDDRLEIFDVTAAGLTHARPSVPVGLEPVAVAVRSASEVWVVNHLSDSVSIVDVAADPPRVVRTLLVGDEPRDIVFAGPGGSRAFITTAHRGQQRTDPSIAGVPGAGDPQLTTPGVGRADVWVFDADALGSGARRHAAAHRDAVRRHAARAGREPRRQHGLRGDLQVGQPDDGALARARSATASTAAAPCVVDGIDDAGRPAAARHRPLPAAAHRRPG